MMSKNKKSYNKSRYKSYKLQSASHMKNRHIRKIHQADLK